MQKIFKGLFVTLRHLFGKKVTIQYPKQQKAKSARFRCLPGLLRNENGQEKCVACKLCELVCPAQAITVTEEITDAGKMYAKKYQLDANKCLVCGLCAEACPTKAITMTTKLNRPVADKKDLIFSKESLLG